MRLKVTDRYCAAMGVADLIVVFLATWVNITAQETWINHFILAGLTAAVLWLGTIYLRRGLNK
jgi:hypothetical protein